MADGPNLAALRSELADLQNRRAQRARDTQGLGWGACNAGHDLDIMAEVRREEFAAEHARVAELEAAIAAMEAELLNSPERLDQQQRQFAGRRGGAG